MAQPPQSTLSEEDVRRTRMYCANFGLSSKACRVDEFSVRSRVRIGMPSSADLKACFKSTENKMLKGVGASRPTCYTPLFISDVSVSETHPVVGGTLLAFFFCSASGLAECFEGAS